MMPDRGITMVAVLLVVVALLAADAQSQGSVGRENLRSRVVELKKLRLLEMLQLSPESEKQFTTAYEAGQQTIDNAKSTLDEKVRHLQRVMKRGSDAEVTSATDDLIKAYDTMVSVQKERVMMLKPLLNARQYALLIMFEIRFPEVLQKLILRRGMRNQFQNPDKK